jgi:hypothetical protein
MNDGRLEPLDLNEEEVGILSELLNTHRDHLLVEIRHTDRRVFRDELRRRLEVVGRLLERCHVGYLAE